MRNRLNPKAIPSLPVGRHSDGDGLYLLVRQRGAAIERLWVFRYRRGGRDKAKERTISLGPLRDVSLAKAREKAAECREAVRAGRDAKLEIARAATTFGSFADEHIREIVPTFKNPKHQAQWKSTLSDAYCAQLRRLPLNEIETEHVLKTLRKVWTRAPETASRLRGRIERILDAAKVRGLRDGDNPARWRGHLELLLPKRDKLRRGHHKALPWKDVPDFMMDLRMLESMSALALEWTILTAARTGEAIRAERTEIDRQAALWVIPAERMKAKREHRVPLCDRCLAIYDETARIGGRWLFPGQSIRQPLSTHAMAECLKGMNIDATVHGFRSSFRDWVADATQFPDWLAEAALAHVIADKTQRAYQRGDALEKRRELMTAWENFALDTPAKVIRLRR